MGIYILRVGHRPFRDQRLTTHVALAARALGGSGIYIDEKDDELEERIRRISLEFGGNFSVESGLKPERVISRFTGPVVHLTMYGLPFQDKIDEVRKESEGKDILIVVGSQKVPFSIYEKSKYNLSVTNQPHSEVSALAVFLDRFYGGKELETQPRGHKIVVPMERGKSVYLIPNERECLEILREEGADSKLVEHSLAVGKIAMELALRCHADIAVVRAGALLHDVGRTKSHGINHAVEGGAILNRREIAPVVVSIVERHIGAGIDEKEALELGLPPRDYTPRTLEEKIVAQADNLVAGKIKIPLEKTLQNYSRKGLLAQADRIMRLQEEIKTICGIDPDSISISDDYSTIDSDRN
ncbi:MAG: tRNA (cytidine(56)-2'-O)-methyltransferase [Candidatus Thermoplasmatota archaeon]|nr:tRNA (cytidine(56)-2'-O)-methyltransferase [Candidatus Thermoplasmatota archaeon]